ncbi:MAG: hypothetical protein NTV30_01510, partial [Chloroflexi bacterium]|nr:hypothetical protein [Chloroflexota bacterium]
QAIGRGIASIIVGLSREFIFILPCIYIFSALIGEPGIWISFFIADVLSVSLAGVLFLKEAKKSGIHFHFRYPKPQPVSDEPAI